MKSNLKVKSDLSSLGMNSSSNISPLRPEKEQSQLSPKELWQKKEKELKIKGFILILLTQLFWLTLLLSEEEKAQVTQPKKLQVESGYQLIKLPAVIYAEIPSKGNKTAISLFKEGSSHTISAYLRGTEEDPIGESGVKAILEVPQNQLHLVKNNTKAWQIFPPMVKQAQSKRNIYEVNF